MVIDSSQLICAPSDLGGADSRYNRGMSDVTRILSKLEMGDRKAAGELLPIVYVELRKLAASKMAQESLDRLCRRPLLSTRPMFVWLTRNANKGFDSRGHFFSAAAEAMRRILIENARRKNTVKHGGRASAFGYV